MLGELGWRGCDGVRTVHGTHCPRYLSSYIVCSEPRICCLPHFHPPLLVFHFKIIKQNVYHIRFVRGGGGCHNYGVFWVQAVSSSDDRQHKKSSGDCPRRAECCAGHGVKGQRPETSSRIWRRPQVRETWRRSSIRGRSTCNHALLAALTLHVRINAK